jgi:hypothetical protein
MQSKSKWNWIGRLAISLLATAILTGACLEANRVAWGTGEWLGEYSPLWGMGFFVFVLFCLGLQAIVVAALWSPRSLRGLTDRLSRLRDRLGFLRWALALGLVLTPVWLFQYTDLGVVFTSISFRLLIWAMATVTAAFLLERGELFITWPNLLAATLLSGAAIAAALPLAGVTSYPFSLGWSEGNRLWDYSILFGRARYIYPADQNLLPFLELGRQFVGGLPFLLPGLTIMQARLWQGLMGILPYAALSLAIFRLPAPRKKSFGIWLLAGLWGFMFLRQGPIHIPLVVSAFIVALAWRRPFWLAVSLIAAASYFAAISRFTWTFAPAMWVGMLALIDSPLEDGRLPRRTWVRASLLALAGLAGGFLIPSLTGVWMQFAEESGAVSGVSGSLARQPLLWYRLLPNSTLGPGILLLFLVAVLPLVIGLIFLARRGVWRLNTWQRLAILGPLTAFLVVGLVASAKIGGGGDLHNMDMLLIGLLFAGGTVWEKTDRRWLTEGAGLPRWMQAVLILLAVLPAYGSLLNLRPLLYADDFVRLKTLTDIVDPYADARVLGLLPPRNEVDNALELIRVEVTAAQTRGEILFMDQRQLLTFGYLENVPLVAEYEKKYLMDQAMGDTAASTFPPFYRDLAAHRFALIISDPLRVPIKDSDYSFGEENNAWVKWVAAPVLCYYEPLYTLAEFKIQLLVPRQTPSEECTLPLP